MFKRVALTLIGIMLSVAAMAAENSSGMDHSQMDHSKMDHSQMDPDQMDHSQMDHSKMDPDQMDHSQMDPDQMDHSKMDHSQMDGSKMDHGAMGPGGHAGHAMAPAATTGPWSYQDRDNPKPYRDNRWEMVPVPGYGHMYISAQGLSKELRCAAIADNPRIMVDRKTRTTCGQTPPPLERPQPPAHGGHDHH